MSIVAESLPIHFRCPVPAPEPASMSIVAESYCQFILDVRFRRRWICHWLLVEFRPQPRKRAFAAIVCFSGLWWDLSLAAFGIPSAAPKASFWSNSLLFGPVAGSVIGCLWNSVHSLENELLKQLCAFRGCGQNCHWLLVEFRPQPRKRAFGAIVCFSGLC